MSARLDRFNSWWLVVKRQRIPKMRVRLASMVPDLYLPTGWALITWSAFGWNKRAWAASVGIYLVSEIVVQAIAAYIQGKNNARRRND